MMNRVRATFAALYLCLLAVVALPVAAQTAGYTKLNVKGRVQLEIPSDWTISPDGHPKLLHCWPVKLLQAGRGDYAGSEVMIRRAAASLSL